METRAWRDRAHRRVKRRTQWALVEHLVCVTWIDHNIIILEVSDLQKNGVDYKVLGMEPFSWRSKVFNFHSNDRAGS